MASSPSPPPCSVAIVSRDTSQLEWKNMNKQELRDALASRGLDTNGLRPSLIQRLQSACKSFGETEKNKETEVNRETKTGTGTGKGVESGKEGETGSETLATDSSSRVGVFSQTSAHRSSLGKSKHGEIQEPLEIVSTLQSGTVSREGMQSDRGGNPIRTSDHKEERRSIVSCSQEEIQPLKIDGKLSPSKEERNDNAEKARAPKTISSTRVDISSEAMLAKKLYSKKNFVLNGSTKSSVTSLSDLDKKRMRAERFGMGLKVSEKEKLAIRAERFAGAQGQNTSVQGQESEKRKRRAARFGILDEATIKKGRLERFGTTTVAQTH